MKGDYYIIMWSCPGNMPKYYPGLRDYAKILPRSERHITWPVGEGNMSLRPG